MTSPLVSIIIPVYNEETRIPGTLTEVTRFLDAQDYSAEIVVVENGSQDRTLEIAREFAARIPYLRVFHEEQRGKGLAVRRGMLEALGEYRFMCDADLSMPVTEINRFIPAQLAGVDIAIASREAPGAIRYNEPQYRHIIGRLFNSVVRGLVLPGIQDSQCGFKCFRSFVAADVFPAATVTGWTFDVEILYIARRRGYRIVEIPIPWHYSPNSKVSILRDLYKVIRELVQIRINGLRGVYDQKNDPLSRSRL